jgi:hypothetical protein
MSFQEGDKVWAQQFGEGVVTEISASEEYPIHVFFEDAHRHMQKQKFTQNGKHSTLHLRPSLFHAGTRIVAAPEPDRKQPKHEFKPFDKVLVRDNDDQAWCAAFFSHKTWPSYCCTCGRWDQCIPYEGNEHLVGMSDAPEEKP